MLFARVVESTTVTNVSNQSKDVLVRTLHYYCGVRYNQRVLGCAYGNRISLL
jgi:hypothetical protein